MKLDKILVPHDGSEHSRRAFDYALDLAKKYRSEVIVASCITSQDQIPDLMVPEEEDLQLQKQKDIASRSLEILELEAEEVGVRCKSVILKTPSVTDAILSYADSNDIDIIILGSRGLGGFKKLLLGSVASSISQYSKCPVLIVK